MTASSLQITEGAGKRVATHEFEENSLEVHVQRVNLNAPDGSDLRGQKPRAGSLAATLSLDDIADLTASDPAKGVVDIPTAAQTALSTPTRGVAVISSGYLAVKFADGSDNSAKPIPVTAGQIIPFRVVQLAATGNTAGLLGLR